MPLRGWCAQAAAAAARPADDAVTLVNDAACAALRAALAAPESVVRDALVTSIADARDPRDQTIEAVPVGATWELSGRVRHVAGATDATLLLVVARSRPFGGRERGLRVYRVDANARGVSRRPLETLDGDAMSVELDGVSVTDGDAVGPPRDATAAVLEALDVATLVAVAEMLGAAEAARVDALAWVSERNQFGAPLADKQVVQHRAADMFIACRAVRLLLDDALARYEVGAPFATEAALAKAAASERLPAVTAAAHQLHGGEGYYADRPLHRWHRRVIGLAFQLGDARVHRARLAHQLETGAGVS